MDAALRQVAAGGIHHSVHRPSLAPYDGKIEINIIAAKPSSAARKRQIDASVVTAFHNQRQAVKAGDLLFIPALMAIDRDGIAAAAATNARQPRFCSRAEAQAEHIIDNFSKLCEAAGTSLANVVRILQFHTDIDEFYPVYKVWERRARRPAGAVLGGRGSRRCRCPARHCRSRRGPTRPTTMIRLD